MEYDSRIQEMTHVQLVKLDKPQDYWSGCTFTLDPAQKTWKLGQDDEEDSSDACRGSPSDKEDVCLRL